MPKSRHKEDKRDAKYPGELHEWVSFEDPREDRTWVFDVTFLMSRWTCIFGQGCQGVLTAAAPELGHGCCSYGAHFTDDEDAARVKAAAAKLGPDEWQLRDRARSGALKRTKSGDLATRVVDGACIFLNRPGFPGGAGCSLHLAAVKQRRAPMKLKPNVCWQLPLRLEDDVADDGHVTSTLRQWDRRHWGPGGAEFHWWCTEAPDAFVGTEPVFQTMRTELIALLGRGTYDRISTYLTARYLNGTRHHAVPLPHPAVRRR
jgi:hypothetical protein